VDVLFARWSSPAAARHRAEAALAAEAGGEDIHSTSLSGVNTLTRKCVLILC